MKDQYIEDSNILDPDLHVLIGHELKTFLNSKLINAGDINKLLKRNGIFVPTNLDVMIPILSSMILPPEDFDQMLTFVKNKEQRPKYRTGNIPLSTHGCTAWIDRLQDNLGNLQNLDITSLSGNIEYDKKPTLEIHGNEVFIAYEARRKDYNEDLLKRDILVKGGIKLRERDGKLEIISTYSSKETEDINKLLMDCMMKDFFEGNITAQKSIIQIKFTDFTNTNRIVFFNNLVSGNRFLKSGRLEEIEVRVDDNEIDTLPLDPEVNFLRDNLKGFKILEGKELAESFFITKTQYYPYYFIPSIDVNYLFSYNANKGSCNVSFFFKTIKRSYTESVLDFSLSEPKYEAGGNTVSIRREIELKLNQEIQKMIENALKKISVIDMKSSS